MKKLLLDFSNQEKFKEYARKMECEVKQKEADMVRLKEELTEEKKKHDSEKKDMLLSFSCYIIYFSMF
jgi:hypothetical protein